MKTKMVNFVINPENVTESLRILTRGVTENAKVLEASLKTNKRLTTAVITLGICFCLFSFEQKLAYERITALEREIESLKPQTEDKPVDK